MTDFVCVAAGLPAGLGAAEGELPHRGGQTVQVSERLFAAMQLLVHAGFSQTFGSASTVSLKQ